MGTAAWRIVDSGGSNVTYDIKSWQEKQKAGSGMAIRQAQARPVRSRNRPRASMVAHPEMGRKAAAAGRTFGSKKGEGSGPKRSD